ncbi:peptide transporter family 1 isoform X2 [Chelonus insularis]|uniref:peptide transporter family 1 isoform X2 n=1 Tax=Chelonus insularis TaxID=460826 RepID=UPI001589C232|nr:peptide transporter family 1 isoform X2 [Chelonus insularis]
MSEKGVVEKKLKYPKSVFFIVSNEFCERFSFYGLRTILALYLKTKLEYSYDTSTVIYHVFIMLVYFFPLFGAIIADSLLGKFKTILYLSIVYAIGQLLLSASAAPTFGLPMREFSLIGLFLIAIGSGGIKPCVAAFGGDQFILPQQEKYLAMFFSVFYFSINSGSLVSTFLTPELRNGVKCFGDTTCYSIAFFVPAVLMIVSIVVFLFGKPMYRMKKPEGNVILSVTKCISYAVYKKVKSSKVNRQHWLDHADDKYDIELISNIKSTLKILTLFIPLPFFWALFDQQASRWTFQATRMDGQMGSYIFKADQVQVINPLFIVIFIPIFETCIYPVMAKIKFINTPLKKMTTGGFLAAVSFIISGLVELQLETTYPILPSEGLGQLRVFNPTNCSIGFNVNNHTYDIPAMGMWVDNNIVVKDEITLNYSTNFSICGIKDPQQGNLNVIEKKAMSYVLIPDLTPYKYEDSVNKTDSGNPVIRVLTYNTLENNRTTMVDIVKKDKTILTFSTNSLAPQVVNHTTIAELDPGTYEVKVNGIVRKEITVKLGGVYTLEIYVPSKDLVEVNSITVTEPNSMHILWMIPQFIIITMGEVMFSITGLEFAFTQAPISMKSILQAGWLFTVAFGNLIVVIIAEAKIFERQALEFFLFAGLMIVDMLIFAVMAKCYKYVELIDNNSDIDEDMDVRNSLALKDQGGQTNPSFVKND